MDCKNNNNYGSNLCRVNVTNSHFVTNSIWQQGLPDLDFF
jgi:hypothetical protein